MIPSLQNNTNFLVNNKAASRTQATDAASTVATEQQSTQKAAQVNTDTLTTGTKNNTAGIYTKNEALGTKGKLDKDDLKAINEQQVTQFNQMLSQMLGKQVSTKDISKKIFANLTVSPEEQAAAKKAISEGGEWSPDAVSERILDMAKALSGGNDSKLNILKDAVKKGFKEAGSQWGDKMPDITQQTYDKVMQGFDDWANKGSTSKPTTIPLTSK